MVMVSSVTSTNKNSAIAVKADHCALLMEICLDPMPLESLRSSRRYATAALRSLYVIDAGANGKPLYDFFFY